MSKTPWHMLPDHDMPRPATQKEARVSEQNEKNAAQQSRFVGMSHTELSIECSRVGYENRYLKQRIAGLEGENGRLRSLLSGGQHDLEQSEQGWKRRAEAAEKALAASPSSDLVAVPRGDLEMALDNIYGCAQNHYGESPDQEWIEPPFLQTLRRALAATPSPDMVALDRRLVEAAIKTIEQGADETVDGRGVPELLRAALNDTGRTG